MSVTKRFVFLLAGGLPFLALSLWVGLYGVVFLIYNAVCFGFLALDFAVSPSAKDLEFSRAPEDKLFFKTENTVRFWVKSHFRLRITLKDEIPDWHFKIIRDDGLTRTPEPDTETAFSYTVLPSKRGSFLFPNVHGYLVGVLGLCRKYFIKPLPMDFKVYPNLRDLSKYRLLTRKKRLREQGNRVIKTIGAETEFESLREYVDGDDYRKINWMATARENKLILNQYETEKNQPVFILVDTGRPMSYSIKGYRKLDYAINAALVLADICNQNGDNSGLMVFDTDVKAIVPPGKGEIHRNQFMEALYHVKDTKNTSDYGGAFLELLNRQKRHGLVFLFTDFETPEEAKELADTIQILKKRHTPVIVLMENESLLKLLKEPDDREEIVYQKAMAMEFLEGRRKIIRSLNAYGIACVESEAEKFALTAVNHYLASRNTR